MKRQIFVITLSLFYLYTYSQTIMDVARSKNVTFYGLDFSQARFIGFDKYIKDDLTKDKLNTMLKETLIPRWSKTLSEFNFSNKYKMGLVKLDIANCDKRNDAIDENLMITNIFYELSTEKIKNIVTDYKSNGAGYGLIFIVESFEKSTEKVYVYVCYFNEKDGSIVSMRRYIGETSGSGIEHKYYEGIDDVIKYSSNDFRRYAKQ